jgi:hypothetical protein
MIIKTFEKFILFLEKDSKMYEYGCLMVYLNLPYWDQFLSKIQPEDLYQTDNDRYGLETEPHCTILYGIHSDVNDEDVFKLFDGIKKSDFDLSIDGIDCFYNKDYDVLKMNVKSEKLNELNSLAKSLPHTSHFQDYKPHLTLAYLQKGEGRKYIDPTFMMEINSIDKIVYSKPSGEKIDITLL